MTSAAVKNGKVKIVGERKGEKQLQQQWVLSEFSLRAAGN